MTRCNHNAVQSLMRDLHVQALVTVLLSRWDLCFLDR